MENIFLLGLLLIVIFCIVFVLNRKTKEHFDNESICDPDNDDDFITIQDFEIISHNKLNYSLKESKTNSFMPITIKKSDEDTWDLISLRKGSNGIKYYFHLH